MIAASVVGLVDAMYLWLVEKVGVNILPFMFQQWYLNAHPPGSSSFTLPCGIPISFAWLGIVGSAGILGALLIEKAKVNTTLGETHQYFDEPALFILFVTMAMCLFGLCVSAFLAHRAIFQIGVVCPLCALSWGCMLTLAFLSCVRFFSTLNRYRARLKRLVG